jgi:hypothetical protein
MSDRFIVAVHVKKNDYCSHLSTSSNKFVFECGVMDTTIRGFAPIRTVYNPNCVVLIKMNGFVFVFKYWVWNYWRSFFAISRLFAKFLVESWLRPAPQQSFTLIRRGLFREAKRMGMYWLFGGIQLVHKGRRPECNINEKSTRTAGLWGNSRCGRNADLRRSDFPLFVVQQRGAIFRVSNTLAKLHIRSQTSPSLTFCQSFCTFYRHFWFVRKWL